MEHTPAPPVSVLAALYANTCQVCDRQHRSSGLLSPTPVMKRHAGIMVSLGYLGYDYDKEKWVTHGEDTRDMLAPAVVVSFLPAPGLELDPSRPARADLLSRLRLRD